MPTTYSSSEEINLVNFDYAIHYDLTQDDLKVITDIAQRYNIPLAVGIENNVYSLFTTTQHAKEGSDIRFEFHKQTYSNLTYDESEWRADRMDNKRSEEAKKLVNMFEED